MKFRQKSESELKHLDDDDLVGYMVTARDTGHEDHFRTATGVLLIRRYPQQLGLVRQKVRNEQDAEDIAQLVIEHALKAKFDGRHAGEFFSMLNTIRKRRIADYFERKSREPGTEDPGPDDSDPFSDLIDGDDFEAEVDLLLVYREVIGEFSERDQLVVQSRIDGYKSKEVVDMLVLSGVDGSHDLTSINCDTIYSRFKKRLRTRLGSDGEAAA